VKKFSREIIVGLFAIVTLVLLYFGYYFLKGIDFLSTTTKYYVVYENSDQLAVSNPVLVNGYAVGRVSHIHIIPEKNYEVLVELAIDSDVTLGDSTKAILTSEFLSGKYILLSIGPVKTPLKSGDTLRAEVAKGMFDVFTETAEPVADNVQTTLRSFNIVIDNLVHNSKQLDTIFQRLQTTPYYLNRTLMTANGRIDELSISFKAVADNLNANLIELKPTITNFKSLSDSLKQVELKQTVVQAQKTLKAMEDVINKMKKSDNTMGKLLTQDSLYNNLNKMILHLDTLVSHFDNNPKHFLGPLGKKQKKIERDRRKQEEKKKSGTPPK
jgi:phospholipid/cholesterol/gamma-HCH transport system substrate-binding protein